LYNNISPAKDHWLSAGSGVSGMPYQLIFGKNEIRVGLSLQNSQAEANSFVFDRLEAQKVEVEAGFGHALDWLPLPNKKACRIQYAKAVDGYDKANWPEMINWLVEHMTQLEAALREPLKTINHQLKQASFDPVEVSDD
jgi:hypothetical protein